MTAGLSPSAAPRPERVVRTVLANRSIRDAQVALAGARAVDLAQLVVVSAFLFSRGGPALVATYGVVRTLVPAVGVPVVTAIGRRLGHGALLRVMAAVAAIGSFAMAAVAAYRGPTIGLFAGAGVVGVALGCFRPVICAALPALVRSPRELMASNAATGFLDGASTLFGPVLGATIGAVLGVPTLLVVTGGGMIAAALVVGRLPRVTSVESLSSTRGNAGRIGEYTAGARELAADGGSRLVAGLGAAQTMVRGAMSVIIVVFAIDVLEAGDSGVGSLYGAMGMGGLVGLPLAVIVVDRLGVHRSFALGLAAWGTPLAICALVATPGAALVLFAIIGVGNAFVDIGFYGALQRSVADRVLSRVLGVAEAMFQASQAAGALVGAVLLDRLGPPLALAVVGIVLPAVATVATPRLRSLDRQLARRDQAITVLRTMACFAPLPMNALDDLAAGMRRVRFDAGQVIMAAGESRDSFVLIDAGIVEIAQTGSGNALLGPGQGFGHGCSPHRVPPTATASAHNAVSARVISSTYLGSIDADPASRAAAVHAASA